MSKFADGDHPYLLFIHILPNFIDLPPTSINKSTSEKSFLLTLKSKTSQERFFNFTVCTGLVVNLVTSIL
jgi:hypothetical protein